MNVACVLSTYCFFAVAFFEMHPTPHMYNYHRRQHTVPTHKHIVAQWQAVVGVFPTFIGLSIVVKYSSVSNPEIKRTLRSPKCSSHS